MIVCLVLFSGASALAWSPSWRNAKVIVAVGVLAVVPTLLPVGAFATARSYDWLVRELGQPQWGRQSWYALEYGAHYRVNQRANEDWAYYGPLGALVVLPVTVGAIGPWLRRRGDLRSLALACALPLFILGIALTLSFNEFLGRFLIVPIALVAPLAAALNQYRAAAWSIAAVGAVMLFLNLAGSETKPTGFPTFGYTGQSYLKVSPGFHVWGQARPVIQALTRAEMGPVLAAVERTIPSSAHIALKVGPGDWTYPYAGSRLSRTLSFVAPTFELASKQPSQRDWVIASPGTLARLRPGLATRDRRSDRLDVRSRGVTRSSLRCLDSHLAAVGVQRTLIDSEFHRRSPRSALRHPPRLAR